MNAPNWKWRLPLALDGPDDKSELAPRIAALRANGLRTRRIRAQVERTNWPCGVREVTKISIDSCYWESALIISEIEYGSELHMNQRVLIFDDT
jgi:hypothetical protein